MLQPKSGTVFREQIHGVAGVRFDLFSKAAYQATDRLVGHALLPTPHPADEIFFLRPSAAPVESKEEFVFERGKFDAMPAHIGLRCRWVYQEQRQVVGKESVTRFPPYAIGDE